MLKNTFLRVFDNSGVKWVKLLTVYKGKHLVGATFPGDFLLVLLKKVVPHKKVKRGDKCSALLLQVKFQVKRWGGFLRCPNNVVVILKKGESLPIANRIYVKTLLEMRCKGFFRIILISRGTV